MHKLIERQSADAIQKSLKWKPIMYGYRREEDGVELTSPPCAMGYRISGISSNKLRHKLTITGNLDLIHSPAKIKKENEYGHRYYSIDDILFINNGSAIKFLDTYFNPYETAADKEYITMNNILKFFDLDETGIDETGIDENHILLDEMDSFNEILEKPYQSKKSLFINNDNNNDILFLVSKKINNSCYEDSFKESSICTNKISNPISIYNIDNNIKNSKKRVSSSEYYDNTGNNENTPFHKNIREKSENSNNTIKVEPIKQKSSNIKLKKTRREIYISDIEYIYSRYYLCDNSLFGKVLLLIRIKMLLIKYFFFIKKKQ